jgi:hypothetical protein
MLDGLSLEACILDAQGSYHWPIQLWVDILGSLGRKPFRFKKFWISHPEFQSMVPTWWKEVVVPHGSLMYRFQQKLKNFKQHLKLWNKENFGNILEAQRILNEQMMQLQHQIQIKVSPSNSKNRK